MVRVFHGDCLSAYSLAIGGTRSLNPFTVGREPVSR